jgi:choline/glycine/proline betaine transport protein
LSLPSNWQWRDGNGRLRLDLNPAVFLTSSALIVAFVVVALLYRRGFAANVDAIQAGIAERAGWLYVLVVNVILGYLIYLMLSPFGRVRIGGADRRPEFGYATWLAMLFSAGMGIGLMFYGVAEPIYHPPAGPPGAAAGSVQAFRDAAKLTMLHWGLHAWGIYALTGLALAYFAFNRGAPLSVRGIFTGLLGTERMHGVLGHAIDVVATVATLFGVATSLGLGALQVNGGLNYLLDVPIDTGVQIAIIAGITAIATVSVVLGLHGGIKRLSVLNIVLAVLLLAFVLAIGPTLFILNGFVQDAGAYLDDILEIGFWTETYTRGSWQNTWTVFYWGWWIAWAPFVGLFIARISIGRTIRELIGGALFAATLMTFVWLAVFGNSALFMELMEPGGMIAAVRADVTSSLFVFLGNLPAATGANVPAFVMTSIVALTIGLVITFFVTSSDSGSLVIDIITAGGRADPPVAQRVYWALAEGVVAAVLLVGGGLAALQTAAISVGLPFALVILAMIVSLQKALSCSAAPSGRPRSVDEHGVGVLREPTEPEHAMPGDSRQPKVGIEGRR